MKLDERRLGDLLRLAPRMRVVLLYGDDPILVADRADKVAATIAGAKRGTFSPAELTGSDHARALEAFNSPLLGEVVRLVRLRGAMDGAAPTVETILLAEGDGVLLVEAGSLLSRSRLRNVVERSEAGVAMACRGMDAAQSAAEVDQLMRGVGRHIDREAIVLLLARADGPRGVLHDAEKLALLTADGTGPVGVEDVDALGQDGQIVELDDLVHGIVRRAWPATDQGLEAFLAAGQPAGLLRALLFHLDRVRAVRAAIEAGASTEAALSSLRPPVFFGRLPAMRQALQRWSLLELDAACALVWRADQMCRATGNPAAAISRKSVFELSGPKL